jgi:predicted CXXCH cytochrome family protein
MNRSTQFLLSKLANFSRWLVLPALLLFSLFTAPAQASGFLGDLFTPTFTPTPRSEAGWLDRPASPAELASSRSLSLLAGKFIHYGLIDASSCPDGGMLKNGAASPCGERLARNAVILWQNQFDDTIYAAALQNGVPPYLLKNIIAQESQFWPSSHPTAYGYSEYGLAHITTMGADTLLRWNSSFATPFCKQILSPETCKKSYIDLPPGQQAILRGAVIQQLSADCSNCPAAIDLQRARQSIFIIAATLKASFNHAQAVLSGLAGLNPTRIEGSDLWRFAVVGYNAGPGCLTNAINNAQNQNLPLSWKNVSQALEQGCATAREYVNGVTWVDLASPQELAEAATDTSKAAMLIAASNGLFTPTPSATLTPTPEAGTPTPDASLTPAPHVDDPTPAATATPSAESTPDATQTPQTTPPTPTAAASPTPALPTPPAPPSPAGETTEVLVRFKEFVPSFLENYVIQSAGGERIENLAPLHTVMISVPSGQAKQVAQALQNNILVAYAEPNAALAVLSIPNDPYFDQQPYLSDQQIPLAWEITRGEGVIIALVDTGVDIAHPDLSANLWLNPGETGLDAYGNDKRINGLDDDANGYVDDWQGWNFVENNNDVTDHHGHGTLSAGLMVASLNNAEGIAGIAPEARLMVLKALNDAGQGTFADVAKAITYAVDHGAKVINLGFGSLIPSETLLAATNYAFEHGALVVAAGGNTADSTLIYPAANPNVIAVAALNPDLTRAAFSTFNTSIQLSAPGVDILSTAPGGQYTRASGSSFSAAEISGIAALLASQPRFDTPAKIQHALLSTAYDLGEPGDDVYYGFGLARAWDALNYLEQNSATPSPSPSPTPISLTPAVTPTGGVYTMAVVSITSPSNGATFAKNTSITLNGTATDSQGGDISADLEWYSNIDGPLGTGASVTLSHLTPGSHTITAQIVEDGVTYSASLTINVNHEVGPHGNFTADGEGCVSCHRAHTAQNQDLTTFSESSRLNNDFCLSCHNGVTATAVSTHSNHDSVVAFEAPFEVLCVQCHDPHGTENLFTIRSYVLTDLVNGATSGQVRFSALTGINSFDDGLSAPSSRVCVTCHTSLTNHPGAANHNGGYDYSGQSCLTCHPHDADGNSVTADGFTPVRGACDSCHGAPPPTGAHQIHSGLAGAQYYGQTGNYSTNTQYIFGCGECHPTDPSKHMDRIVEVEVNPAGAPADSFRARSAPSASYSAGTCSNVYCHSGETVTSGPVGNPLTDGSGQPVLDSHGNLTYDPYTVTVTRTYRPTPDWFTGSTTCSSCHDFPLTTSYPNVEAGVGNSHQWVDNYGYGNLHAYNMGFGALSCRTCHYGVVTDSSTWSRDGNDVTSYGDVPIADHRLHVNGAKDVLFDTVNPIVYRSRTTLLTVNLSGATYNPVNRSCSNVGCHLSQNYVEWGTPYRWWLDSECDLCHRKYLPTPPPLSPQIQALLPAPLATPTDSVHTAENSKAACTSCHSSVHK